MDEEEFDSVDLGDSEAGSNRKSRKKGEKKSSKPVTEEDKKRRTYLRGGMLMMVLAMASFVTGAVFSSYTGAPPITLKIPPEELKGGKIIGKIETSRDHASYQISLKHPIFSQHKWSQVTGEVLDAKQNTLFAFGEELWADFEENKQSFSANFNFPKQDTYYLKVSVEMPPNTDFRYTPPLEVTYGQTGGSGVMFNWLGALAIVAGIGLIMVKGGGVGSLFSGFAWMFGIMMVAWPFLLVGGIVFLCIYFDVDCTD